MSSLLFSRILCSEENKIFKTVLLQNCIPNHDRSVAYWSHSLWQWNFLKPPYPEGELSVQFVPNRNLISPLVLSLSHLSYILHCRPRLCILDSYKTVNQQLFWYQLPTRYQLYSQRSAANLTTFLEEFFCASFPLYSQLKIIINSSHTLETVLYRPRINFSSI